jgi:adenylosuccinate lyase
MTDELLPNVLADRYASKEMKRIWSQVGKIITEREFWIALMKVQASLGINIPQEDIARYEAVICQVNLESIRQRESKLKHDVKARLEEFNATAGCEHIHKGMTSRDLTENVEQMQITRGLRLILNKSISVLDCLAKKADTHRHLVISARTHNVAAQPTTLGRRFSMFGEELLWATKRLEHLIDNYPCRGIKGAVGTQQDQLTLLNGDKSKVAALESRLLAHLGFTNSLSNTGQVYPRSLDFDVISSLYLVSCALANLAKTLRLMAGHELISEGFSSGQVGSSAMPHKMNSRSAERLSGLQTILKGHVSAATSLAGDQWNEGDVSCSVVRRVLLPDSFLALDAVLDTALVILEQMEVYEPVIALETARYAPFLATTTLLMAAIQEGGPREQMHEIIKKHAIAAAQAIRQGNSTSNDLATRLGQDPEFPLGKVAIDKTIQDVETLTGRYESQIESFRSEVEKLCGKHPQWSQYTAEQVDLL